MNEVMCEVTMNLKLENTLVACSLLNVGWINNTSLIDDS